MTAAMEDMFMIDPPPAFMISGMPWRQHRNVPSRSRDWVCDHTDMSTSVTGPSSVSSSTRGCAAQDRRGEATDTRGPGDLLARILPAGGIDIVIENGAVSRKARGAGSPETGRGRVPGRGAAPARRIQQSSDTSSMATGRPVSDPEKSPIFPGWRAHGTHDSNVIRISPTSPYRITASAPGTAATGSCGLPVEMT